MKIGKAIITGGSLGIGTTLAECFAPEGAAVVVNSCGRSPHADAPTERIRAADGTTVHVVADVARPEAVEEMIAEVLKRFSRIDILANNDGLNKEALLPEMSQEQWDDVLGVNLNGAFHCTKAVIRPMALRRSGVIINISYVAGEHPLSAHTNYNTANARLMLSRGRRRSN